ncbi:hypothetical protein [Burkholderia vietnamiensis]|uniref:hypothetical protein n=1 Tax=Burkholderia vietnamiensis TaxID=60552 RepID=UPI00104189EB|nr:hypothetical protein [Burkholderia vietnamiensis]
MAKGGKRPGAGRPPGRPNKVTADIKALAQVHAESAIRELATILTTSENDQARISAAKELLDRGFGKATQHAEITGKDGGPVQSISTVTNDPIEAAKLYAQLMNP